MISLEECLTKLIAFQSITPNDAGCQDFLATQLEQLGFQCQWFNCPPVSNLFARIGSQKPFFLFAGHTDVVPVGDLNQWKTDPFKLTLKEDMLYGRGTADMKGSIAAMLTAAAQFIEQYPSFKGSLGFLITSGEEGNDFEQGTPYVMQQLPTEQLPDYCIVGEPSSQNLLGDMIKIGRRGSLSAELIFEGKQGHVAYPHLALNPIHSALPALTQLIQTEWDKGNDFFPPTSLQITHIQAGGEAGNIIPGKMAVHFNIRYSNDQTAEGLIEQIEHLFSQYPLSPSIYWRKNGNPFLTAKGLLVSTCKEVIQKELQRVPDLSTSGGTSDARFIAPYRVEVIELGPSNATIHQVNECVSLTSLKELTRVYYKIIEKILV